MKFYNVEEFLQMYDLVALNLVSPITITMSFYYHVRHILVSHNSNKSGSQCILLSIYNVIMFVRCECTFLFLYIQIIIYHVMYY